MSSRLQILKKIKNFQSDGKLPELFFETDFENSVETFIENAQIAGAKILTDQKQKDILYEKAKQDEEYFLYESTLGVAENGAIWASDLKNDRSKLFICEKLIINIKKSNILQNMHQAYEKISFDSREFGTFISGPSKTADIEQSLVLGAHGAMELFICLED